jgi:hypothetical protein
MQSCVFWKHGACLTATTGHTATVVSIHHLQSIPLVRVDLPSHNRYVTIWNTGDWEYPIYKHAAALSRSVQIPAAVFCAQGTAGFSKHPALRPTRRLKTLRPGKLTNMKKDSSFFMTASPEKHQY